MTHDPQEVTISLSTDVALVLDALLATLDDQGPLNVTHPAELMALWKLSAALEKVLVAPFKPEYNEILAAARARLTEGAA